MAWRIADNVIRGELDCRVKGRVTGAIWLRGHGEPLRLSLEGRPLRDLAGCLLTFTNPDPKAGGRPNLSKLAAAQHGVVGDMTASRKIVVYDLPLEEIRELARAEKEIPTRQANSLYLEWFSENNGRVLIESTDFQVALSAPPTWQMTDYEEREQIEANLDEFADFLDDNERTWTGPGDADDDDPPMEENLDEFKWEKMLKESDVKADKLGEVMQKYDGHPDSERLVAREMQWTWVEDELDAEERGLYDDDDEEAAGMGSDDFIEELMPNPLTEGKDWMRDKDGEIHHPLCHKAFELGIRMWRFADEFDLLSEDGNRDIQDMVFNTQTCSAKLAGALNHLAYDLEPDSGLVVASLKRALNYLHIALQASEHAKAGGRMDASQLEQWRRELFEIREEIIRLMNEHRAKLR